MPALLLKALPLEKISPETQKLRDAEMERVIPRRLSIFSSGAAGIAR
jgi:hypothetical protein